jgi:hypothetical protein
MALSAANIIPFDMSPYDDDDDDEHFPSEQFASHFGPAARELVEQLATESDITLEPHDNGLQYRLTHPLLEHTQWGTIDPAHARQAHSSEREAVSWMVIGIVLRYLSYDLTLADELALPLGCTVKLHGRLLRQLDTTLTGADIAFHLQLPVLDNVPVHELLVVRQEEHDHFLTFRSSLRSAIRERARALSTGNSAEGVANEIRDDVIEPAVAKIRERLLAARHVLNRSAGLSVAIGALGTVVGAFGGPGFAEGGWAVAAGGVIAAGSKYQAQRTAVEDEDMYFLWEAASRS